LKLINQNRFQAVISKIGKLTDDNINTVLNEYVEDVWTDFYQNFSHITISDYDKANEYVKQIAGILITDNL
jgi:hypothetical protein